MKRTLSLVLSLVLFCSIFSCLSVTVNAASVSDLTFKLNSDGMSYTVTKCETSASGEIVIPDVYTKGFPVTSIGDCAFLDCITITSVTIPDTLTSIGNDAFHNCTSLSSITIPNSVTSIGYDAFLNCTSLTSITIPNSVTSIGDYASCFCDSLTSITIPDNVTSIGDCTFCCCTSLASVNIPNSVTSIGEGAFYGCIELVSVTIPNSVTNIGNDAFNGCTNLEKVNWNAKNVDDLSSNSYVFENAGTSGDGIEFVFGNSVEEIPDELFSFESNAPKITSVVIGDNVTSSVEDWFSGSSYLESIVIGDSVTSIGDSAFDDCTNLTSVIIGNSVTSIGREAFGSCTSLKSITIPDSVTSIGVSAFYNCTSLTSITIPDSVIGIGGSAFLRCASLTSITIPNSVTNIVSSTFDSCTSLVSVTIPNSVKSIGDHAFCNCTSLTSITIPDSVTSVGITAFFNTGYYNKLSNWQNDILYIGNHLIEAKYTFSSESCVIKEGTKTIAENAFSNCTSLTSITIPKSVTSIGSYSFSDCDNLKYVFCPDETFDFETKTIYAGNDALLNAKWHYGTTDHIAVKDDAITPTCTVAGKTEGSHCSVCNIVIKEQSTVPARGHQSSDWIIDVAATCGKSGSKHKECVVCKTKLETKVISATGNHIATDWIIDVDSTCTKKGSKHTECKNCGTVLSSSAITEKPHQTEWFDTVAPTCLKTGTRVKKCVLCNTQFEIETVSALGHTPSDWIIDKQATCTVNGSKHTQCTICGVTIETKTIVATGHTKVIDAGVPATCTIAGKTEGSHCSVCSTVIKAQTTVPAKGHTAVKDAAIPATCTTAGKTEGSHCSVCNAVITAQNVVNAKGHTISDWIVCEPATVSEPGLKQKECTVCGEILITATIPQLKPATPKVKAVNTINGMKVTWNAVDGAVKYGLYKRLGTDNSWTFVTTTTATFYADNNTPLAGSYYVYTVKAYNSADMASDYIKANCASVQRVVAPKTGAANVVGGINVSWPKVAGASKYVVLRRIGTESTWKIIGETTGNKLLDTNVTEGIYYIYSVRAVNTSGYSEYDINKRITVQRILTPLATATNLVNGVQVKWNAVTSATKYNVYRRTAGSSVWTLLGTTTGTSFNDKNVVNGTYYVYSIRAINGTGYSAFDTTKTDTIQPITAPTAKVANKSSGVQVSWNSVSGATKYNVYRRLGGTSTWVYVGQTTGTSFIDTGVVKGKSYAYSIRAINGTGYSAYDSSKCASIKHS